MERLRAKLAYAGFAQDQMFENECMARHTTMRVGGNADMLVTVRDARQIASAMDVADQLNLPILVMGGGSNLIVRDGGIRGLVIMLGERFSQIEVEDNTLIAQAGVRLSQLSTAALKNSLTGLEFVAGIPGTVGGGIAMNAGAYGGEMKNCLKWAELLINRQIVRVPVEDMDMGYRRSRVLRDSGVVVLRGAFELQKGDPDEISATMADLSARRRDKQPLNFPSSGSTFKRPEGYFAGALIESAGLKGFVVGGAQVSEKHAGFVVNTGEATARDVLELIRQVQNRVYKHSGVTLECEVRVVGED